MNPLVHFSIALMQAISEWLKQNQKHEMIWVYEKLWESCTIKVCNAAFDARMSEHNSFYTHK